MLGAITSGQIAEYIVRTRVVTCGRHPLESSFQKAPSIVAANIVAEVALSLVRSGNMHLCIFEYPRTTAWSPSYYLRSSISNLFSDLNEERIEKTKRNKNDQKPTRNGSDKNKSEKSAKDKAGSARHSKK
ncbi:hypothetical protein Tco_0686132 [Tanacetum coccineum]